MAYTPREWTDGETVEAADANRWEQGIHTADQAAADAASQDDLDALETSLTTTIGTHTGATEGVHGIADTAALVTDDDQRLRDTGWREIHTLLESDWSGNGGSRRLRLCRVGNLCYLEGRIDKATFGDSRASSCPLLTLPAGFRPYGAYWPRGTVIVGANLGSLSSDAPAQLLRTLAIPGTWADGDSAAITATWRTTDPWPTSLPGTPA